MGTHALEKASQMMPGKRYGLANGARGVQVRKQTRRMMTAVCNNPKTVAAFVLFTWFLTFVHAIGHFLRTRKPRPPPTYGMPKTPQAIPYKTYAKCLEDPSCTLFPKKNTTYPTDYPGHPWHWARENDPNPTLAEKKDCKGSLYIDLYHEFHEKGYVIFESCSLKDGETLELAADYTASLKGKFDRFQNAANLAVKELAVDKDTLEFLEYLHGDRRAFPFQTLNLPKGSQQALHSDLVHFDSSPRTLVASVWTALEDITPLNGPVQFVEGSHHYGVWDFDEIGFHTRTRLPYTKDGVEQNHYGEVLAELTNAARLKTKKADRMKKGQSIVCAAGTVHGGSPIRNAKLTRFSQISSYFFEGADFYWHPLNSDLTTGHVAFMGDPMNPIFRRCSQQDYAPRQVYSCADSNIMYWKSDCFERGFLGKRKPCKREHRSWDPFSHIHRKRF